LARHSNREWLIRAVVLVAAVTACHLLEWNSLRFWTSEAVLRMSNFLGVRMHRVSQDVVSCGGQMFNYTVSCTFIDVFCGAIALSWNRERSIASNVLMVAELATGLFVFNAIRLTIGFVLFDHGAPWLIGHEAMSGVAYFMVWIWLMRQFDDPIARFIEQFSSRRRAAEVQMASGQ